jgi:glycosyltransferase involved in cell wall biosynthesis
MGQISRLLYISQGNIPSKWAHTVQTMKMAQAFAKLVPHFELLTQGSLQTLFRNDVSDIFEWYGIRQQFCIKRLPLYIKLPSTAAERDYFPRFIRVAVAYAKLHRSAIVYTREFHVAYLATRFGIPTILERHGFSEHSRFHFMEKIIGNPRLLGIVTISNIIKESYVKEGVPANKILVWPDAVDLDLYKAPTDQHEVRMRLGIAPQDFLAVYVGHLYPHKGVQYIIEAARLLPEYQFVIVGGWPKDIARYSSQADGLRNVRFVGYVPNVHVPAYLATANVLLLPNSAQHREAQYTSPLKLFEYMAARRPIIASDIPAFNGILKHGINAYLITPDSSKVLAEALRVIEADKAMASRMTEIAWNDVQAYTWEKRALEILQTFVPELFRKNLAALNEGIHSQ